jgi:hypothetical protein
MFIIYLIRKPLTLLQETPIMNNLLIFCFFISFIFIEMTKKNVRISNFFFFVMDMISGFKQSVIHNSWVFLKIFKYQQISK